MTDRPSTSRAVRFGIFELDRVAGELRKNGLKVRLQDQPLQLLSALVERPGEVVTREELKEKLWPGDTYVDFDRSLNTAASRLREALGDSASNPRFVETLPKRGYRFLASVETQAAEMASAPPKTRRVRLSPLIVAGILAVLVLGIAVISWKREPAQTAGRQIRRFTIASTQSGRWSALADPAISPDGKRVAFVGASGADHTLWIHSLDAEEPREVAGTGGARNPFWSPDSKQVGFVAGREVWTAAVDSESPFKVCDIPGPWTTPNSFGAWSPDGGTVFFSVGPRGLYQVPAGGGIPERIIEERAHGILFPPSGKNQETSIVYGSSPGIVSRSLETGEVKTILGDVGPGTLALAYAASGHLLFSPIHGASAVIQALPFSPDTLEPAGEPFVVQRNALSPSVAGDGTLVYLSQGEPTEWQPVWRDRSGRRLGPIGQPQPAIRYVELSGDETRVAVTGTEGDEDIWIHDVARPLKTRLTFSEGLDRGAVWSSSGKEVAYATSLGAGSLDIYVQTADGSGEPRPILATDVAEFPTSWSRDGNRILFDRHAHVGHTDIWYLERTATGEFEPAPFLETEFDERAAKFSPDGNYVIYVSNESGSHEIYVREFPGNGSRWRVSENGGTQPRWGRNGKEVYYCEEDTLLAVPVKLEPEFSLGSPERLFRSEGVLIPGSQVPRYDVTADGQRFVVREPLGEQPQAIHVVLNWFEEFREQQGEAE